MKDIERRLRVLERQTGGGEKKVTVYQLHGARELTQEEISEAQAKHQGPACILYWDGEKFS